MRTERIMRDVPTAAPLVSPFAAALRTSHPFCGRPKRPHQSARTCGTHRVAWLASCSVALFRLVLTLCSPSPFSRSHNGILGGAGGLSDPMSPARCPVTDRPRPWQQASDRTRWTVKQAGGDSARFSGISARKGGISAAIEACVPEATRAGVRARGCPDLQSGQCQALPVRGYMHLMSPARFLETFEAFGP